jgi:asparagine synthase (glutamine-hydrolysing)
MCGLTGFWNPAADWDEGRSIDALHTMADKIKSRGPDSKGVWFDQATGLGLAHRRLAIVDLSSAGHQPMHSISGRSVIAYNGEIYNANEMRMELEQGGIKFRSHSDTEVLLEGCEHWGVEAMVKRCIGMFAFAFWSREHRRLSLVRDRVGIKPLYWGRNNGVWFFASQPKSIVVHQDFDARVNRDAMARFIQYAYVPAPDSIYQDLEQLRPGHLLHIEDNGETSQIRYWDLPEIASRQVNQRIEATYPELVDELEELLLDAVGCRMIAEVPLGAFLSGGVDSSVVVAMMQARSSQKVRTFSIGFHEQGFNEAEHAGAVARHLGTDHTEMYVSHQQVLDLVPRIAEVYDEPFGDSSQLPTQMLCSLTQKEVTVALSGDGGDELFAGYNRYLVSQRLRRGYASCPRNLRKLSAGLIRLVNPSMWDRMGRLIPAARCPGMLGDKLHKLSAVIDLESFDQVYPALLEYWSQGNGSDQISSDRPIVPGITSVTSPIGWSEGISAVTDPTMRMQLMDMLSYLPDDILTKVDRASMDVSLEARVPLLDHRVVEYSWRLPQSAKLVDGRGKLILRDVLDRYVPRELIERPKMGFGVPLDAWLRGPLRDWAEDLLDPVSLQDDDMFDAEPIQRRWSEHLSGNRNWQYSLWNVMMAQAWRRTW